jgi:pilus assembly protein CpaB
MTVALVAAAAASLGVYQAIRRMPVREVEVASTFVVAATAPLEMGVKLTREHVKLVAWPKRSPLAGAFAKPEDVIGRGLVARVAENEPITAGKLAKAEAGAGLPPAIKPGMRAMSVKVNDVIGVAGFVAPGAHVDVLATIRDGRSSTTNVVVSDAEVLTAGTRNDQGDAAKKDKPAATSVVTLMVTPTDAGRIALAANDGQIMLALRNPLDTAATPATGVRTTDLTGPREVAPAPAVARPAPVRVVTVPAPAQRPAPAPVVAAAPPPPAAPPVMAYTIETIKAGKRDKEMVR